PEFAKKTLGSDFRVTSVLGNPKVRNDLPGIAALESADVMVVSVRRRALPKAQLDLVRRFVAAGKPVIGLRTASHAFALLPNNPLPEGHEVWATFDPDVLGGHYVGHHTAGPKTVIRTATGSESHPILRGVDATKLFGSGSLYR